MNKKLRNRIPALYSHVNFGLILLYGCCLNVKFFRAGIDAISGQIAVDGGPTQKSNDNINMDNFGIN